MAQMSFSDLTTQVQDWLPGKLSASVARAANLALRELFMVAGPMKRFTVSTTAPYSTGTIAITQGLTAVVLTGGTFAAGTDGQLIRIDGDETWFTFTRTAGTTGNISSAWTATTVTVATFEVAYAFYDLPTDILGPFKFWRNNRDTLHRVSDEQYSSLLRSSSEAGDPGHYAMVKSTHATTSALRMQLIPSPDDEYTYTGAGKVRATVFPNSAPTTEYTGLPEELDPILVAGTLYYLMDQRDKEARSAWWVAMWKEGLRAASVHNIRGAVFEPWNEADYRRYEGPIV